MAQGQGNGEGLPGAVRGYAGQAGSGDEEAVLILRVSYRGKLPEGWETTVENRAYDYLNSRGGLMAKVIATVVLE